MSSHLPKSTIGKTGEMKSSGRVSTIAKDRDGLVARRLGRSRVLSFGDYRRRVVTGQQNDAHQRCGSPPPIDATLHQTNSAIALQKCRNNSECSGLKGWLGANNHGVLTMARDEH